LTYSLRYHPDVSRVDLPKLDRRTARQIGNAILSRLTTEPTHYGSPLRHTLKSCWKLRVGDYRVVYRIVEQEVRILAIIHRSRVYELITRRL
jgi:mRNA interferase RelE/StbE